MNTVFRIRTIAQYSVLEGLRGRVILVGCTLILASILLAEFSGQLVLTDTWQTKISIYAFLARISLIALIAIYIINSLVRDRIENQTEWLLSTDMPRVSYLLGRTLGFLIVTCVVVALVSIYPLFYSQAGSASLWIISLLAEALIVVFLAVFIAITFNNTVISFITVSAFYLLARNIGNFVLIAQSNIVADQTMFISLARYAMNLVHYLLPDLWRYADTRWLIYDEGNTDSLIIILVETIIYSLLLLSAAAFDLYRKNFTESLE